MRKMLIKLVGFNDDVNSRVYSSVSFTLRVIQRMSIQITQLKHTDHATQSRDSVVGIATGYGLNDRELGVRVSVE
jgi:hypothetical protein